MIEALKIKAKDQIKRDIELTGLGKVNIICGKNNSGKSTLLLAISNNENLVIGKKTEDVKVDTFFDYVDAQGVQIIGGNSIRGGQEAVNVKETTKRHVLSKEFWFYDDALLFSENVDKELRKYKYAIAKEVLINAFQNNFQKKVSSLLIPNKRNLDLETENKVIETNSVGANGKWLLNELYYLKNQLPNSEDRKNYELIVDAFREISGGYSFEIKVARPNHLVLFFSDKLTDFVLAGKCGLGLQDLMIIIYFALLGKGKFLLIEEPETHLHPDMQRRLAIFLREETEDKQFFFTTHSNIFLNSALVDKVFFTSYKDGVEVRDETNRASILSELGYDVTDNLVSDLVILVEGPTDVLIYESLLMKMGIWEKYNIKFWPLGGHIMDRVDLSVFAEKYSMMAIVDRDDKQKNGKEVRDNFKLMCETHNIDFHRLEGYSIESYFPLEVLQKVLRGKVGSKGSINDIGSIDIKEKLKDEIGIDVKNQKNMMDIAKELSPDDIKGTDLYDFLLKVKKKCEDSISFEKR